MDSDYDVVIIGGAFSGAATALMLKRKRPEARVLIIEKTTEFDRKVGESTTEVSSCYMTRILGLTHYLGHHQLAKQGLRLWFSNRHDQRFDDCVEVGTRYQSRLPGFQVDRAKLDSHMLDLAAQAGASYGWRKCQALRNEGPTDQRGPRSGNCTFTRVGRRCYRARHDAREAVIFALTRTPHQRCLGAIQRQNRDSYEWRQRFLDCKWLLAAQNGPRTSSRRSGPDHSIAGRRCQRRIVYDNRIFKLLEGESRPTCTRTFSAIRLAARFSGLHA
jgi:hypothetical protein